MTEAIRCPHCAELGHHDCYEAGRRAGREDAARDIDLHFGDDECACGQTAPQIARGGRP